MQYGSIGWSVGATLGYAQAVPDKRVIACIGETLEQQESGSTTEVVAAQTQAIAGRQCLIFR